VGAEIALYLVLLTGAGGQVIEINPAMVVSVRAPAAREYFARGTRCIVTTVDGKFVTVQETCDTVRRLLETGPTRKIP